MRKKLATMLVSALAIVGLAAAPTFAWSNNNNNNHDHYGLSGSGQCQPDGSFQITWTIDNTSNYKTLYVKYSSNTVVVPNGTQVPGHQTKDFVETESGTTLTTYNLYLDAYWHGDKSSQKQHASVTLSQACTQPTPPPSNPPQGGKGGGSPSVKTTSSTPQVTTTPSAPVNAGDGAATYTSPFALGGLVSSVAVVGAGLGLRRFKQNNSL